MLYGFVKILMRIAVKLFYQRIYSNGIEQLPKKDAGIIIANHASSLMDAAIIGILSKRPIYFFARGDIFINRPVRYLLGCLHMIPVYHHQLKRETTNHNDESFDKARKILENNGLIVFFPEGSSHTDRKLNPLKKGVFRMAFQTLASPGFKGNLWIIPAGINYSHVTASQSIVTVNVSAPVLLNEFHPSYRVNPSGSLRTCAQFFYSILLQQVLHINDDRYQVLADRVLQLKRNNILHENNDQDIFKEEKKICDRINKSPDRAKEEMDKKAAEYFNQLQIHGINDKVVAAAVRRPGWKKLLLVVISPLLIVGYVLNLPPVLLAKTITDKKVYRPDFYSWIYVASGALMYVSWVAVMAIFILFFAGWKWMTVMLFFILLTGLLVHIALIWLKEIADFNQYRKFQLKNPVQANSLPLCRKSILESIE